MTFTLPDNPEFILRPAEPKDVPQILQLIKDLAEYEKEPDAVKATEESLHDHLFRENPALFGTVIEIVNKQKAETPADAADDTDAPVLLAGMALWFLNFSTWGCTHGIYLEDLYVRPELRGKGLGKQLLQSLAQTCVERNYQRLEWCVLKWNKPSIDFYHSVGAFPMDEWDTFRLTGDALAEFGRKM